MSRKQVNTQKLSNSLKSIAALVSEFQASLNDDIELPSGVVLGPLMSFSRGENGGIQLSGDEVRKYQKCLDDLSAAVDTDIISRSAIDGLLKDFVLVSLDVAGNHPEMTMEERIKMATTQLKTAINASPTNHRTHYRVSGISVPSEISFGNIRFTVFNKEYEESIKNMIKDRFKSESTRNSYFDSFEHFTSEPLIGEPVAIVEVLAIDDEAAKSKALKELRLTIDIINFFSDIIYRPREAYISLYGSRERRWESLPVLKTGDEAVLTQSQKSTGRSSDFSIRKLINSKDLGIPFIQKVLKKSDRSPIESRIISSLQWAGRATVDDRAEEAFLLYAIALESLLMERTNDTELGYRLRMRTAHLLGSNLEERKSIKQLVSRLYSIRSAIVHKGEYIVADSDLKSMRFLTKNAIMKIILDKELNTLDSDDKLINWFEDRILG